MPLILTLVFEGRALGKVEFGPPGKGSSRQGMLYPDAEYVTARPALQTATLDLIAQQFGDASEIQTAMRKAHDALTARGLALVDENGVRVPTRTLVVGDYSPANDDPSFFAAPPVPVAAIFEDSAM